MLISIFLLLTSCGRHEAPEASLDRAPERIIALAPNITDTLYDLGLADQIVGISRFSAEDRHSGLSVVGDFMHVNYEMIVSLQPDLVILEKSSDAQKSRLESLGIPCLETGSLSIRDILDSIRKIGETCHVQQQAAKLIEHFRNRIVSLQNTPYHRPRTLIAFSDFSGTSGIEQIYAFGSDCIHSELLTLAGGDNVIRESRPSVTLSREAVLRLNPELIIELSTGGPTNHWEALSSVDAIRNRNIQVLSGTYTTIPSPANLLQTLEDFSRIIRQYETIP